MNADQISKRAAVAVCQACGMPVRVIFEGDEIVEVFAVCGHVTAPKDGDAQ